MSYLVGRGRYARAAYPNPSYRTSGPPGTPGYNPAWYALTDIYWDPQAGLDTNTGKIGSPVQHFYEIIGRYGSTDPQFNYAQTTNIHKLSAQPLNTDPVFFAPKVSGGGSAVLLDTLVIKTPSFTGGAVTPRDQATGQRLQVAGFPAGTAAGDYVYNQTRNSYGCVDVGGVSPIFVTPIPASLVTTVGVPNLTAGSEDNTWTTGDSFIVYTRNNLNLKLWRPRGGDASATVVGVGWVQWSSISDTSGNGTSEYPHLNEAGASVLSGCQIGPRLHMGSLVGRGFGGSYVLGCDLAQPVAVSGTQSMIWGSVSRSSLTYHGGIHSVDGGTILHGQTSVEVSTVVFGDVFADGLTETLQGGSVLLGNGVPPNSALWGTGPVTVQAMSACVLSGGTWAGTLLTTGQLKLGANTVGSAYQGEGVFLDGIALNVTNIAAGGPGGVGLQNPLNGARFCNQT